MTKDEMIYLLSTALMFTPHNRLPKELLELYVEYHVGSGDGFQEVNEIWLKKWLDSEITKTNQDKPE